MTIEPWADPELSARLASLCAAGEGQSLEFKSKLPATIKDLAKEIAAFASTDGGLIIVGVNDDGSVCGVEDGRSAESRDMLFQRVVGISQKVDPPVLPHLSWAQANGEAVFVIAVEKGSEPIYYVEQRPYLRHANVSRPATPAEVTAAIARSRTTAESPVVHTELSTLARLLAEVLMWCDIQSEMRNLKPWVDEWMVIAECNAAALREVAASEWATADGHSARLEATAERLDAVAGFHHVLSDSGPSFEDVCADLRNDAAGMFEELIWPVPLGEEDQSAIRDAVVANSRNLASVWARTDKNLFDGRVEKAQDTSSTIGKRMAPWCYFKLTVMSDEARSELLRISLRLFELATEPTYYDGGESQRRIVSKGTALSNELADFVQRFLTAR